MNLVETTSGALAVARYYCWQSARSLGQASRVDQSVVLGARLLDGRTIELRRPRLQDWSQWRALRLEDRQHLEPFWPQSAGSWDSLHSRKEWANEVARSRERARWGTALPSVVMVDGHHLGGQCNLEWINWNNRCAELGGWGAFRYRGMGSAVVAGLVVVAHAFDALGLVRIEAPIHPRNGAARRAAQAIGFTFEGVRRGYALGGQTVMDHEMWSMTAADYRAIRYGDY